MKMSMNKVIWLFLLIVMGVGYWKFQSATSGDATQDKKIPVGVVLPMTGDWSKFGSQMEKGIRLWEKDNPNSQFRVVVADGKGMANDSVRVLHKLADADGIKLYISGFSSAILAMAPVVKKNKLFMVNAGATNPSIKAFGKCIFTLIPDADEEASYLSGIMYNTLHQDACYVLHQNDESGRGLVSVFSRCYCAKGGVVLGVDPIGTDADIINVLHKIRMKKAKAVFIPANGSYVAKIIKQAYNIGLNDIQWLGYAGTETPDLEKLIKGLDDVKLFFSTYAFSDNSQHDEAKKSFIQGYRQMFNEQPAYYAATCYDAMSLIDNAFGVTHNLAMIPETVINLRKFHGVSGTYEIAGRNYVSSGLSCKTIVSGKIVPLSNPVK